MNAASDGGLELAIRLRQGVFTLEAELSAAPGEVLVLVGPSGAGKSTLLRAIAGLARPEAGYIRVHGRTLFDSAEGVDLPPWERRVGMVFQDFALFPHLSVEQNVRFGLRGRRDARSRARRWLEVLGLSGLARRRPGQLSGGQQQRVALARAAAAETELLLLDEPFGSLDAATRRSVRGELRRFLEQARAAADDPGTAGPPARTTLLVSHDYLDALTLGDRIVVLEQGRITQDSPREEALRHPRTPFLAAVTGHNVLQGEALPPAPGADTREVRVGPLLFHVAGAEAIPPGPVLVGFGPQEVLLAREPGAAEPALSARNRFPAVVRELVPLPDRVRVHLDAGVPILADVVRQAVESLDLREGARVVASVKATAVELYR